MWEKLSSAAILIIFYFIAAFLFCHGNNASIINCSATDLEALLDFKSGLNDPEGRLSSWRGHSNCCQWSGIGCDAITGAVIEVDLHNPYPINVEGFVDKYGFLNLSGDIRPSLLKLKSLRYLDLSCNTFEGITIPEFLGSLNNLQYLNLSKAGFAGSIPPTLGNLSSLQYLDISSTFPSLVTNSFQWVSGLVSLKTLDLSMSDLSLIEPNWLEILNSLPYLTGIHLRFSSLPPHSISSLSYVNFTSLTVIDLSGNSFLDMFPSWLANVSSLTYVDLVYCDLRGNIPVGFSEFPNLRYLDLSSNDNLSVGIHKFLNGSWNRIEYLDLGSSKVHGKLPSTIGNMIFLTHFSLSSCNVQGGIPSSIGKLCNLQYLDLSLNKLSGSLPESLEGFETCGYNSPLPRLIKLKLSYNRLTGKLPNWLCQLLDLEELNLSNNLLDGPIPDTIGRLRNLVFLGFTRNKLTGTLPESFGKLAKLSFFDVSFNELRGIISEKHFADMSNLKVLLLTSNSLILNFSSNWLPQFQVFHLGAGSCRIGPKFPSWLKNHKQIQFLDLSNASISGPVPEWFWDLSVNLSLLNFSHNQLEGKLPNPLILSSDAALDISFNFFEGIIPLNSNPFELFDISNNNFEGHIPQTMSDSMPDLFFLSLSGNKLTGDIPPRLGEMISLLVIDLSKNNLAGSIPDIGNCSSLNVLDLGNNSLSGEIPTSLGQLSQLQSLHLDDNKLSGELPYSFQNLSNLETLDLRNNLLSGNIPSLFEDGFTHLRILNLRANQFEGDISTWNTSSLMCLQVLDLAENYLSGRVPASFGDLQAMTRKPNLTEYLLYGNYGGGYYEEGVVINFQNSQRYTKTLSLLTAIDISDNDLSGEFPSQLIKLSSLRVLNMSRNKISGQIPQDISRLNQLLLLDLSSNNLIGEIPPSMVSMSALGYLNLSNNNLSGTIPYTGQLSTFSNSYFEGNPNLCGGPLQKCQNDDSDGRRNYQDHNGDDQFIDKWFYLSLGLGFFLAILIPYFILAIRRPWMVAYFNLVNNLAYKLLSLVGIEPRNRNRNVRPQITFHI